MSFPTKGQIYKEPLDRIKGTLGRVSLDTFYQVTFSFGKMTNGWFRSPSAISGSSLNDGLSVQQKMSLMCTEAELPGTAYNTTSAIGHYQGIQESFATLRDYPPLNLTFYVDVDHVMIEVFERWMNYINPSSSERASNSFKKLRYPNTYKEVIHITKYERDFRKTGKSLSYEFINVWPTNMSSMKVNYGQSNVLKLSIQLAYDRYFTTYGGSTFSMGSGADVIETATPESADHPLNQAPKELSASNSVIENTNGSSDIFGYIEASGEGGDAINPDGGKLLYPNGTPVFVNGRMRNSQFDTIK